MYNAFFAEFRDNFKLIHNITLHLIAALLPSLLVTYTSLTQPTYFELHEKTKAKTPKADIVAWLRNFQKGAPLASESSLRITI